LASVKKAAPATADRINPWYYSDAPKTMRPLLDLARRTSSFDEVQGGLSEDNALFEARRCLSCGNCFECDNCYGVCPDNAVIKLGPAKVLNSITTTARAAVCVWPNAPVVPSTWCPKTFDCPTTPLIFITFCWPFLHEWHFPHDPITRS
jgi:ferredoxin